MESSRYRAHKNFPRLNEKKGDFDFIAKPRPQNFKLFELNLNNFSGISNISNKCPSSVKDRCFSIYKNRRESSLPKSFKFSNRTPMVGNKFNKNPEVIRVPLNKIIAKLTALTRTPQPRITMNEFTCQVDLIN